MTTEHTAPSVEALVGEIASVERAIADIPDDGVFGPDGRVDPALVDLIVREYDAVAELGRQGL
ncbi:MAG: hypothetical protein U0R80_04680 [Nocardioidaceae bacterium]|mgnify:CR=1 FL=1